MNQTNLCDTCFYQGKCRIETAILKDKNEDGKLLMCCDYERK